MFIALGVAALLWAVPAGAQVARMRMEIPFTFVAGDRVLPAGAYWVTVDQDFHRCRLDGLSNSTIQLIRLLPASDRRSLTNAVQGTLRFTRYGGQHFLSAVWRPGHEQGTHEQERSQDASNLDHKHDRVAELVRRIEFYERIEQGTPYDL